MEDGLEAILEAEKHRRELLAQLLAERFPPTRDERVLTPAEARRVSMREHQPPGSTLV